MKISGIFVFSTSLFSTYQSTKIKTNVLKFFNKNQILEINFHFLKDYFSKNEGRKSVEMPPTLSESSESENVSMQETFAERMLRLQGWTEGKGEITSSFVKLALITSWLINLISCSSSLRLFSQMKS